MGKRNSLIKELENLSHDYQYLKEMREVIEHEDLGLTKIYWSLKEMKKLKLEIGDLDLKLKNFLEKLIQEEQHLIYALEHRQRIHDQISELEQPYRNVLYFRYVSSNTFDEIALKMNYSTKRIYQLHKEAIDLYCEKFQ